MKIKNKFLLDQLKKQKLNFKTLPSLDEWKKFLITIENNFNKLELDIQSVESELNSHSDQEKKNSEKQKQISLQLAQASKMASLGTLASGIAHELNNPLAGIRGHAELLEISKVMTSDELKRIERILILTDRAVKIVKRLLKFARKPKEIENMTVHLAHILKESIELGTSQFKYDNVNINIELDDDIFVFGDSHRLISVFQNLLNNSYDEFLRSLQSDSDNPEITIRLNKEKTNEKFIVVDFIDNAGGIPDSVINEIFDPFFTTKDVGKGTGLGLSLVQSILEELGGNIEVKSQNRFTTFTLYLKKALSFEGKINVLEKKPLNLINLNPNKTKPLPKLLLVDDEPDLLDILENKLKGYFNVTKTESSVTAIQLLQKNTYDLLITDLRMPNLSGKDLIKFAREKNSKIAICLVSGHAKAAGEYLSESHTMDVVYIEKPLPKMERILELIEHAFEMVDLDVSVA
jgi:signal transduction histidine kinase/ActR/RegA family two-component response regulator